LFYYFISHFFLANVLIGKKLSAVSKKPNTTRNRISGIKTLPNAQLIFLDTPGIQRAKGQLGKAMVQSSIAALGDADVNLLMIDVKSPFNRLDSYAISNLSRPAILLINKIDLIKRTKVLEIIKESQKFDKMFTEVIPISALKAYGIDDLLYTIVKYLPEGPLYFPDNMITDIPEKFLVAERIREKVFNLTHQEIPYKTAVFVDEFEEVSGKDLIRISAIVYVERKNHKGIVIGKKGQMLKQIGTLARIDIERILGARVYLKLWVKVKERWTERADLINEFGYAK